MFKLYRVNGATNSCFTDNLPIMFTDSAPGLVLNDFAMDQSSNIVYGMYFSLYRMWIVF